MYNRYIPQPDGSYSRNRVQEPRQSQRPQPSSPPPEPQPCPPPPEPQHPPKPAPTPPSRQNTSAGDFLRRLLPKGLDTGDLLVVLLLLLMAGDCTEDKNTALLTLVLYLFM